MFYKAPTKQKVGPAQNLPPSGQSLDVEKCTWGKRFAPGARDLHLGDEICTWRRRLAPGAGDLHLSVEIRPRPGVFCDNNQAISQMIFCICDSTNIPRSTSFMFCHAPSSRLRSLVDFFHPIFRDGKLKTSIYNNLAVYPLHTCWHSQTSNKRQQLWIPQFYKCVGHMARCTTTPMLATALAL